MARALSADGYYRSGNVSALARTRLIERLTAAAEFPVALIIAPAGYGKSVLLRQYFETTTRPAVRFSVRAEHGELLGFLRGFAEALEDIAPHAGSSLAGAYERNQTPSRRAADLARWLHAHIDESFRGTIAIDDLHNGENDPDIGRFIATLIDLSKNKISWILASRSTAGLPVGSWFGYRDADLPIGEGDLRFTLDEATAAADEMGLRIGRDEMRNLLHITEGWPAALAFALATSTRSTDLQSVSAVTRDMMYRFLAEQVYNALTDDERALLDVAIALPTIDVAVLERAGFDRALQIVEGLHERTAFISGESPKVYRCHDLFREFLRRQAALRGKQAQEKVHERAARALERSGDFEHALGAYTAAASKDDIVRLLEAHGFDLLERAQSDVVAKAIEALDERTRRHDGVALALQGAVHAMAGRRSRAEALFRRALSALTRSNELAANVALRLATILANDGREASLILSRVESDERQNVAYRVEAASFIAAQKAVNGHHQAAAMAIDRTLEMLEELDDDSARAKTLHKVGIAYHHLGERTLAVDALCYSSDIASDLNLYALVSRANAVLSNLAVQDDDVGKQLFFATRAREAASKAGDIFALQTAMLQLLSAHTRIGDVTEAEQLEKALLAIGTSDVVHRHVSILRAVRIARNGRFDEAHSLLAQWSEMPFDFDRMGCGAAYALCLALDGKKSESSRIVKTVASITEGCSSDSAYGKRAIAAARSFCALTEAVNGRITHAQRFLRAVDPDSDVIVGLFHAVVSDLTRFLGRKTTDTYGAQSAIARLIASDYSHVGGIFEAVCRRLTKTAESTQTHRHLTKSELAILKSLESGLSPKEIAEGTNRSLNTVRVHIANVVVKLECHGQVQAVQLAKKLGLI